MVGFDYLEYIKTNLDIDRNWNGAPDIPVACPNEDCHDRDKRCYVNPDKCAWICFSCDYKGGWSKGDKPDLARFLMFVHQCDWETAKSIDMEWSIATALGEQPNFVVNLDNPRPPPPTEELNLRLVEEDLVRLDNPDDPAQAPYWSYLLGRGMTIEEARLLNGHFDPNPKSMYSGRVLLPVYKRDKSASDPYIVCWCGRDVLDRGPKYRYRHDGKKSWGLWPGMWLPSGVSRVVLVEGIFDALALYTRAGVRNVRTTLSTSISEKQIDQLKAWGTREVILFWDPDATEKAEKATEQLRKAGIAGAIADLSEWPSDKDPGDLFAYPELIEPAKRICAVG